MTALRAVVSMPPEIPAIAMAIDWGFGSAIYFFSAIKLANYINATSRFDQTMKRLNERIAKLEQGAGKQEH